MPGNLSCTRSMLVPACGDKGSLHSYNRYVAQFICSYNNLRHFAFFPSRSDIIYMIFRNSIVGIVSISQTLNGCTIYLSFLKHIKIVWCTNRTHMRKQILRDKYIVVLLCQYTNDSTHSPPKPFIT